MLNCLVAVQNENLAHALQILSEDKREIILLAYFLDMSDREIAEKLNLFRIYSTKKQNNCFKNLKRTTCRRITMRDERKYQIMPYTVIEKAVKGDNFALNEVLQCYKNYIEKLSQIERGSEYLLDEEIKQMLQIKLITKVMMFKLD